MRNQFWRLFRWLVRHAEASQEQTLRDRIRRLESEHQLAVAASQKLYRELQLSHAAQLDGIQARHEDEIRRRDFELQDREDKIELMKREMKYLTDWIDADLMRVKARRAAYAGQIAQGIIDELKDQKKP